ncbi:hypothetical protein ACA910_012512 [Epithemia clementina (nom. ined.)]
MPVAVAFLTAHTGPSKCARLINAPHSKIIVATRRLFACKIAVIGGGASGIFSAIAAAESLKSKQITEPLLFENLRDDDATGSMVTVLEATTATLGKVKISGGGRCNVLHDTSKPVNEILQGYPRGQKELTGILHKRFPPSTAREWFESRGVELKTESDGRMFPATDSSQTIIDTLLQAASKANVQIHYRSKVEGISICPSPTTSSTDSGQENKEREKSQFCVTIQSRSKSDTTDSDSSSQTATPKRSTKELYFDAVILATGSTPAGYRIVQGLDLTFVPTVPSLFTLNAKSEVGNEDGLLNGLAGISVPFAEVAFCVPDQKKPIQTEEGPLLITHHGLSGPAVLRMSAFGARELAKVNYKGILRINWAPHLGKVDDVFDELWQSTTLRPKKQVNKFCPLLLPDDKESAIPRRLWSTLVQRAGFEETQTWATASKKLVRNLAMEICRCEIEITGKSTYKDEFVTAGGVSLKEIDMKAMQSKKYPGLFFCGEVVNVDGVTGGYNFLNCWSTGYVAGNSAAEFVVSKFHPNTKGEGDMAKQSLSDL